ncbi:hypothetical protein BH11PAT1_BH11PAT1_7930 [soil metagenome]
MKRVTIFISTVVITITLTLLVAFSSGMVRQDTKVAGVSIATVELESKRANPDIVLVRKGEYVQFESKDGKIHDISLGHGDGFGDTHEHEKGFESGPFAKDEAYKVQLNKVGIFDFHDHLHPDIHITVIVKE